MKTVAIHLGDKSVHCYCYQSSMTQDVLCICQHHKWMQKHNVFFSQNLVMDFRGLPAVKTKSKDENSEKKRPTEEGTSLKPPLPRRKFLQLYITLMLG